MHVNTQRQKKDLGWIAYLTVVTALMVSGFFVVSPQKLYKPGDDIGYNMGLVGGVMMLFLLVYPLRKRNRFLNRFGALPAWFKWHMIFGIMGPALIVFHSTFHIGSVNAAVAMACMLLVSGSGIFGRFFYTKIHHGLYGRQTTMNELKEELEQTGDVKSVFSFAPNIEKALEDFRDEAEQNVRSTGLGLVNFIKVNFKARILARYQAAELQKLQQAQAIENGLTAEQRQDLEVKFGEYHEKIEAYIKSVRDTAQFNTYERLFSMWHIFHIPLVYMMVFSAVYHVYAVHAY